MLIKDTDQPFPDYFFGYVKQYTPLYRNLMRDNIFYDAEDLEHEIFLKILERFKTETEWKNIENQEGYLVTTALHTAFTLKRRSPANHRSLDADDYGSLDAYISDKGSSYSHTNREIDYAPYYKLITKMLEEFSDYEKLLIQLNFIEGCKPALVAVLLVTEYLTTFEDVYGAGMLPGDNKKKLDRIKKIVQIDCNAACAKFRQKLKKNLGDSGKDSSKRKSDNE